MNSPGAMLWARDDVLRSVDRVRRAVSDQHELVGLQSTFVLEDVVPGGVSPSFGQSIWRLQVQCFTLESGVLVNWIHLAYRRRESTNGNSIGPPSCVKRFSHQRCVVYIRPAWIRRVAIAYF